MRQNKLMKLYNTIKDLIETYHHIDFLLLLEWIVLLKLKMVCFWQELKEIVPFMQLFNGRI